MSVIRILTEAVANKIAAGEVIERPASVVKELVENSLDAGAERVEVAVEAGGKRLIRVIDDGCGMSHDDTLLAFERHATSKIRSADDLFAIATLGFRGEALPSIAAVSRLALETRHASESSGTRIEFAGGKLRDVKEVAWDKGTRAEVRDLFFNTPARRKFLKSESTELGHIASLVTHYALAHPQKTFRLSSTTNEILNVSPVATHRERIYQVMGGQLLEQLVEVAPLEHRLPASPAWSDSNEEGSKGSEAPLVRVSGFVSRPEVQKLNRNSIYFFVNRRLVRDRLILHAITEAYRNILSSNVFPVALVFLDLPATEVDINVHPSKIEVRFRSANFVHDLVRDAARQALVAARPVPTFPAPDGQAHPADTRERVGASYHRSRASSALDSDAAEVAEKLAEEPPQMKGREGRLDYDSLAGAAADASFRLSESRPEPQPGRLPLDSTLSLYARARPEGAAQAGAATHSVTSEFPADLEPLGQVRESFIVATNAQGLWILDQHVVHERILFERHLRLRAEKKIEVQRLLLPVILELRVEQQVAFQEITWELTANGFEVEPFGQRTIAVKTAPVIVPHTEVEGLVLEILDSVNREAKNTSLQDLHTKIAASVSCHAAIKINTLLDRAKMQWLLRELAKTECPMSCPHGRPIILRYDLGEIEKAFKRC